MKIIRSILKKLVKGILLLFVLQLLLIVALKYIPVYYTSMMFITSLRHYKKEGKWKKIYHKWVPLKHISPDMVLMTIAGEDGHFMEHHGFDFEAIEKAYKRNNRKGRIVRGGSTISQQTAKNVFLYPDRTYTRKGLEAYFTIMIELIWGKRRIIEVYLNSVEMGNGIYGVESCAELIFGKTAKTLSREECAKIVSMFPFAKKNYQNPRKGSLRRMKTIQKEYRNLRQTPSSKELLSK